MTICLFEGVWRIIVLFTKRLNIKAFGKADFAVGRRNKTRYGSFRKYAELVDFVY